MPNKVSPLPPFLCLLLAHTTPHAASSPTPLEPINVNSTREPPDYSPLTTHSTQTFSVLSANDFNKMGSDRLEDRADYLPGVQIGRFQAGIGSDFYLRGFALGGRLLVNGLRDQQGYFIRDPATIETTEWLMGADSVAIGASAPGGTINFITKQPSFIPQRRLSLQTGTPARQRLVLDTTAPLTPSSPWAYRTLLIAQHAKTGQANVNDDRITLFPSLLYQDADSELLLEWEANRQQREFDFDRVFIRGAPVYNVSYVDPRTTGERDTQRLSAHYSTALNNGWQAQLSGNRIGLQRTERLVGFYALDSADEPLPGYYRDVQDDSTQTHTLAALEKTWHPTTNGLNQRTRMGLKRFSTTSTIDSADCIGCFELDIWQPRFDYALPNTSQLKPNNFRTESDESAVFLQHRIKRGKTKIEAGVRHTTLTGQRTNTDNGSRSGIIDTQATPTTIGLSHQFAPNWQVSANRQESFTPNSGYDRNGKLLPPRHGIQHEIGLTYRTTTQDKPATRWQATLYQLKQDNLSVRDPLDRNARLIAGNTQTQGAEFSLNTPLNSHLTLDANYSYQAAHLTQQDRTTRTPNAPKHSGSLTLDYQPNARAELFVGAVHIGKRAGDNTNSFEVPAYTRLDAGAKWQINQKAALNLGVRNLLDEDYVASSEAVDFVVQGRKRTVTLGLEVDF